MALALLSHISGQLDGATPVYALSNFCINVTGQTHLAFHLQIPSGQNQNIQLQRESVRLISPAEFLLS